MAGEGCLEILIILEESNIKGRAESDESMKSFPPDLARIHADSIISDHYSLHRAHHSHHGEHTNL
jgi:hypothetical protein